MWHQVGNLCRFGLLILALRVAASADAAGPPSDLDALRSEHGEQGFEQAIAPRPFVFPRDHGPHPQFRHEWWYVTGNLEGPEGQRFGFELTFFRFALAPPDSTRPVSAGGSGQDSHWRTRQIYMAHFAITDVERGQFTFAERFSREAIGLAGARAEPFRVWLGDWSVHDVENAGWRLQAAQEHYALELDLQPSMSPVLNGEDGLSRKGSAPGQASYYYSIPRMAARGVLTRDGEPLVVSGEAWLDREWGTSVFDDQLQGWDWFAFQLEDGSTLMIYQLRRPDGSMSPHSAGTWVDPGGNVRRLAAHDLSIDVLDHWTSPRGGRYPARWRLRVAGADLDLEVQPVLPDQELDTATRYWEGAVDVTGTRADQRVGGRGYVELVGYGERPQ